MRVTPARTRSMPATWIASVRRLQRKPQDKEKGRKAPFPMELDQSKVQKSSTLLLSTMNRAILVLGSFSSPL